MNHSIFYQQQDSEKHSQLIIQGGTPLSGVVRLGGAKNASYKLMIASIMAEGRSCLLNLPDIEDVKRVACVIEELGGKVWEAGPKMLFIDAENIKDFVIDGRHGRASRASTLFVGPLLAKFGQAKVPIPGGDQIGKRPLDRHLLGLEKLGVEWVYQDDYLILHTDHLVGAHYKFAKNTHTGTETLIMAAVLADGQTVLENAALEPEVDDLIQFLNDMGAKIKRTEHRVIEIEGVKKLHGAIHRVMPDRNEAVSYACAALVTKGDVIIENADYQDISAFVDKVIEMGAGYEADKYGVRFFYQKPLLATNITTSIHPGFMTDWQPLFAILLTQAKGKSIIHETVMQNRFQYMADLNKMGADIKPINIEVDNPNEFYNFNWSDDQASDLHAVEINGPTNFVGGEFTVCDLRAGATILLAAISGSGTTVLNNVKLIDRGYERIDKKLRSLGANIIRQEI